MTVSIECQKHDYTCKSIFRFGAAMVFAVATASTTLLVTTSEAGAKQFCIEYNGNRVCGGEWGQGNGRDGGNDRGERPDWGRPKPPKPVRLPVSFRSNERVDVISVSGRSANGKGKVRLCLKTKRGMWKKRLIIQGRTLNSENGHQDCDVFIAGETKVALIKAKFGGKMEHVGIRRLNLTGWGGGTVTIRWIRD